MLQKPRGTRDFLPDEMEQRREIEMRMRKVARNWGYREICTPTFETQELYVLRSGEGIINEMYTFEDKGGRKLALRPEGTAAVIRMYVNEAKVLSKPLRWCYLSDCYRYERPQKGRYRQFWQFGAEQIGADTPAGEAEIILLAYELLKSTGVRFELHIGHLAPMKHILSELSDADRKAVMALLDKKNFDDLKKYLDGINAAGLYDSLIKLIECKNIDEAIELCNNCGVSSDMPDKDRMKELIAIIDSQNIDYKLNLGIVRGLDYYTGMVFEGFADNLGAENQILGGGSYRLAHLFGGDDTATCGFGIGFDRVMVSLGEVRPAKSPTVAVVYTADVAGYAFSTAKELRNSGINTELNLLDRGIGAQMKYAAKTADYAVVIGAREAAAGTINLKDLKSGEQRECKVANAIGIILKGI